MVLLDFLDDGRIRFQGEIKAARTGMEISSRFFYPISLA